LVIKKYLLQQNYSFSIEMIEDVNKNNELLKFKKHLQKQLSDIIIKRGNYRVTEQLKDGFDIDYVLDNIEIKNADNHFLSGDMNSIYGVSDILDLHSFDRKIKNNGLLSNIDFNNDLEYSIRNNYVIFNIDTIKRKSNIDTSSLLEKTVNYFKDNLEKIVKDCGVLNTLYLLNKIHGYNSSEYEIMLMDYRRIFSVLKGKTLYEGFVVWYYYCRLIQAIDIDLFFKVVKDLGFEKKYLIRYYKYFDIDINNRLFLKNKRFNDFNFYVKENILSNIYNYNRNGIYKDITFIKLLTENPNVKYQGKSLLLEVLGETINFNNTNFKFLVDLLTLIQDRKIGYITGEMLFGDFTDEEVKYL
jgi:hypothetical protein